MDKNEKPLTKAFTQKKENWSADKHPWEAQDAASRPKSFYGIERGNRYVRRFKLFLCSGQVISLPYALLPVVILDEDKHLHIKTHDLEITIRGRNLEKLGDYLNEEQVLWIKEAHSDMDDTEEYDVYIKKIDLDGNLFF